MIGVAIAVIQKIELVVGFAEGFAQFINPKQHPRINGLQWNWRENNDIPAGRGPVLARLHSGNLVTLSLAAPDQSFIRKSGQRGPQRHPADAQLDAQLPFAGQPFSHWTGGKVFLENRNCLRDQ